MAHNVYGNGNLAGVSEINGIRVPSGTGTFKVLTAGAGISMGSLNGGPLGYRNLVINGGFDVWNRVPASWTDGSISFAFSGRASIPRVDGGGSASRKRYYGPDRFVIGFDGIAPQYNTRGSLSRLPNTIVGAPCEHMLSISGLGGSSAFNSANLRVATTIETGYGVAGPFQIGTTWTISLYSSRNLNGKRVTLKFVGGTDESKKSKTMQANLIRVGSSNRYYATITINQPPNAASECLQVKFFAPDYNIGQTWNITGVQVERGNVLGLYESKPIALEEELCSRYVHMIGKQFQGSNQNTPASERIVVGNALPLASYKGDPKTRDGYRCQLPLPSNFRIPIYANTQGFTSVNWQLDNTSKASYNPYIILSGDLSIETLEGNKTGTPTIYGGGISIDSVFGSHNDPAALGSAWFSGGTLPAVNLWFGPTVLNKSFGYGVLVLTNASINDGPTGMPSFLLIDVDF